jgi:predicted RNase H-like nuclease (RuvC/YqgF family)
LRDDLANVIRKLRGSERSRNNISKLAQDYITNTDSYIDDLKKQLDNYRHLTQAGAKIVTQQDTIIRALRDEIESIGSKGEEKYLEIRKKIDPDFKRY